MSGVCVELRRRPPPQRGERKNGPKTAPLRHERLQNPLRQSPKLSNSRILRGSLEKSSQKLPTIAIRRVCFRQHQQALLVMDEELRLTRRKSGLSSLASFSARVCFCKGFPTPEPGASYN